MVNISFSSEDVIIEQGAQPDSAYIVESGAVEVYLTKEDGTEEVVAELGSGSMFGEYAINENIVRTASVRAIKDTIVQVIDLDPPLERQHCVNFSAGSILFEEGQASDVAYIIEEGVIEVSKKAKSGENKVLSQLTNGSMFGDEGVVYHEPRVVSARALTDVRVYVVY